MLAVVAAELSQERAALLARAVEAQAVREILAPHLPMEQRIRAAAAEAVAAEAPAGLAAMADPESSFCPINTCN
jgi:hypothetical protein